MLKKTIVIGLSVIIIAGVGLSIGAGIGAPKIGYINTAEVYSEFGLKKELEVKLKNVEAERKNILDSLRLSFDMLSAKLQQEEKAAPESLERLNRIRQQYLQKEQEFSEDNQALADDYTEQIWQQLNQYIKDYGKKNNYRFILGANGDGAVMYADEGDDITKLVNEYVNSRYAGKK